MLISPSLRCLLGAILVKFGSALLFTWGKTNVYFFSYYKETQPELSISYNTLPVAIMAIPVALLTIFSVRIAKRIGFRLLIIPATIVQSVSLFIAPYMTTYLGFLTFYLLCFGIGYSCVAFPVFSCVWSYYKKSEGRVSGLLLGAYGIASVFFVILITYLSNPTNEPADLQTEHNKQIYNYFSFSVAKNAHKAAIVAGYIASGCCLIGGLLVTHKPYENYKQVKGSDVKVQELEDEAKSSDKNNGQQDNSVELDQVTNVLPMEYVQDIELPETRLQRSVSAAIRSVQFFTILMCLTILSLFLITLSLNYKTYFLSKINEDYFITFVDLLALLISAFANVIWGFLIDKVNFKILFALIYFFSGLGALALPISATYKISFSLVYITTMVFDKGALVITGPALIKIFGDEVGHQLFPLTYISSLFSIVFGPVSQYFLLKYFTFDIILYCQGVIILIVIFFIIRLNMNYQK